MSALLFIQIVVLIAIATAMTYYAMILLIKNSMDLAQQFTREMLEEIDDEDETALDVYPRST